MYIIMQNNNAQNVQAAQGIHHHIPELNVHETPGGVGNLLEAPVRKIKVIDIATARWVNPSNCGATPIKLQAGAVVCHMDIYGVVALAGQAQTLQHDTARVSIRELETFHKNIANRVSIGSENKMWLYTVHRLISA